MQEYEVRRGQAENVAPDKLKAAMQDIFGNVEEKDGKLVTNFGALKPLSAWACKKNLCVDTVPDDVAGSTIKAFNTFLERVTGYTAKERGKRAQKKVKAGKL